MRRLALIACLFILAACATPTTFGPAASATGVGYSEYRIEPGRYRVTFRGGGGAPEAQVSDYALLRAAQLTLRDGYDWFQVTDRFGDRDGRRGGTSLSIGGGGADFGRRSSVGLGVGATFDLSGGPQVTRSLEVVMGKGPPPQGPDSYDARGVVANIAPGPTRAG